MVGFQGDFLYTENLEEARLLVIGGQGFMPVEGASQSGWRMPALTAEEDELLATTPAEELLRLPLLQPEKNRDTLHAYQMAKRCNEKRVMAESVKWGARGARLNATTPGIIVTPLVLDEFNGPRGDFYKDMFAKCPAGCPGSADEAAHVVELLMSGKGAFITSSTFLIDGELFLWPARAGGIVKRFSRIGSSGFLDSLI